MIVTRHEVAKNGQNTRTRTRLGPGDTFCDWISIYQEFASEGVDGDGYMIPHHRPINGGLVVVVDSDKVVRDDDLIAIDDRAVKRTSVAFFQAVGSYSTSIQIKSDGFRVEVSGNVGRFARPDNLFGFSVLECVEIASDILNSIGLPRFTPGNAVAGEPGAVITRVDLTRNFEAGSEGDALRLLSYYSTQARGRQAPRFYNNGVTWGEGSRRWYAKLYYKPDSLGDKCKPEVGEWARSVGLLRDEISLKATWLGEQGLHTLHSWQDRKGNTMENVIYAKFADVIYRPAVNAVPFEEIPGMLGRIARDYAAGVDVWNDPIAAPRTRRRWRAQLRKYGIDIAQPCNVRALSVRPRVLEIRHAERPDWYSFGVAA